MVPVRGIEPRAHPYHGRVLPLYYTGIIYLVFSFRGLLEQYTEVFQEAQGEIEKSLNNLKPTLLFTCFFEENIRIKKQKVPKMNNRKR